MENLQELPLRAEVRQRRHREADAKWRSSLSECYATLSHIVPAKIRKRTSRQQVLEKAARHINMLECTIHNLLDIKAKRLGCTNYGTSSYFDIQHYREHFLSVESYDFCSNFVSIASPAFSELYETVLEREYHRHLSSLNVPFTLSSHPCPITTISLDNEEQGSSSKAIALPCTPASSVSKPTAESAKPRSKNKWPREPKPAGKSARRRLMEPDEPWPIESEKENDDHQVPCNDPISPFTKLMASYNAEGDEAFQGGKSESDKTILMSPLKTKSFTNSPPVNIVWLNKEMQQEDDQMVPTMLPMPAAEEMTLTHVAGDEQDNPAFFNLSSFLTWYDESDGNVQDNQVVPWLDTDLLLDQ